MSSLHTTRYKRLISKLLSARREAGLTQAEAAKGVGRLQSYVSKCESGERRLDVFELCDLAQLYGKSLGFFVAEADVPSGASLSRQRGPRYQGTSDKGKALKQGGRRR